MSSPSSLKDPPSFSEAGDDDILRQWSEKSPMLSSSTIDSFLLNSMLDIDGESTSQDSFPQLDAHISSPCFQQNILESSMDILKEAVSPDTDVHHTLQEFLNTQNLLNSLEHSTPEDIIHGFQDLGYPNMPLTPWIWFMTREVSLNVGLSSHIMFSVVLIYVVNK